MAVLTSTSHKLLETAKDRYSLANYGWLELYLSLFFTLKPLKPYILYPILQLSLFVLSWSYTEIYAVLRRLNQTQGEDRLTSHEC